MASGPETPRAQDVAKVAEIVRDTARRALATLHDRRERTLVHEVIDLTDVQLSENCGRNEGLSYEHARRALDQWLASRDSRV